MEIAVSIKFNYFIRWNIKNEDVLQNLFFDYLGMIPINKIDVLQTSQQIIHTILKHNVNYFPTFTF